MKSKSQKRRIAIQKASKKEVKPAFVDEVAPVLPETKVEAPVGVPTESELDKIIRGIEKTMGKGILRKGNDPSLDIRCIPTGIKTLDKILTRRGKDVTTEIGIPMGRTIELFGEEGTGKSTMALKLIASAQKLGYKCAFLDCENVYDKSWASKMGVKTEDLFYSRLEKEDEKGKKIAMPSEEVFELMKALVTSEGFKVVVLDSVAALCPSKELEDKMGDQHYALVAKQMSKAMRVFTALNKSQGTIMVFINQLRSKIGIMWGNPNTTTGGKALPFYASLRLEVRRGEWYPKQKGAIAQEVIMKVKKDKIFGRLGEDARFLLFFEDGNIKYWDEIKDKKPKDEKDDE